MTHLRCAACALAIVLAAFTLGCARPRSQGLTPAPLPAEADRPFGWLCTASEPAVASPVLLYREAARALQAIGVDVVRRDSVAPRLTVAGPTAPRGRGSKGQQAAHLYLDWSIRAAVDSGDTQEQVLATGISDVPPGLTPGEIAGLYAQADSLAARWLAALPSVRWRLATICDRPARSPTAPASRR